MVPSLLSGIDLVDVVRFRPRKQGRSDSFLKKTFTESERAYCFAYADPAPHFAGIFAAKEAVAKALDASIVSFIELEIRHTKGGMPQVWQKGRKLRMTVSITHTDTVAAAVAVGYHTPNAGKEKMSRARSR